MASPLYIGVDVGGTKIDAGLISGKRVLKKVRVPTEVKRGTKAVIKNISQAIANLENEKAKGVKGIGIGIAGQIDVNKGRVISSPNLPKSFRDVDLAKAIKWTFKKPVKLENDANAFTLAEATYGAGKKHNLIVGLTLGTGIGGAIIIDKQIIHGAHGTTGELGHQTIVDYGENCSCGQRGHLEAYAAGPTIVRLYKKLSGKTAEPIEVEKRALGNKDAKAKEVFKLMSDSLATGLANIINTLDPEVIIIGGGLSNVKIFVPPAIKLARKRVVYPTLTKTKIVRARLGQNAALIGPTLLF